MTEKEQSKVWNCMGIKIYKSTVKRYFAMFNICLLGIGTFVCFDSVGAYQKELMKKFSLNNSQFSFFYAVNSWANIIISPFGGFLIDRVFGIRLGTLFYGLVFLIGHLIYALGVLILTLWCSLLGRFINGVGHEFVYIGLQLYSVHYFKGKELSLIMCINVSVSRLGSSLVYSISEPLIIYVRTISSETYDLGIALFIVGSFTILTMVGAISLMIMTPKAKLSAPNNEGTEKDQTNNHSKIKFKEIFILPLEFWFIIFIQISFCITIYVFLAYTQNLFTEVHGLTIDEANGVTSFFNFAGVIIAPIVGIVVDKIGREIYVIHLGFICAFLAHLFIGFFSWSPYVGVFVLSLSYGLFNGSVLPMMAMLIPEHRLGTAFGVLCTFLNLSYAICQWVGGATIDRFGFVGFAVFMIIIVGGGAAFSIALHILNNRRKGTLNMTPSARKAALEKQQTKNKDEALEPLKTLPELNGVTDPR